MRGVEKHQFLSHFADPRPQIAPSAPSYRGLRECPLGLAVDLLRPRRGAPGVSGGSSRQLLYLSFVILYCIRVEQ